MYIFFNTATYEEIERDVKVETTLWVLTKRLHLKSQKSLLSTTCKVTTEAALGLIGGTMGLLNGFSILSGVEIIYHLLRFYIEHLSLSNKHLSNKHLSNKHLLNQCFILPHHSHCNCLIFLPIIYIHRICILVP